MVSKNQIKVIASLQQKKYRAVHQMFVAEGQKVIQELIDANFELVQLLVTETIFESVSSSKRMMLTTVALQKISALNTANNCLAVFKIPSPKPILEKGLMLALDDIRDPGNLGTILRICDWYGIEQIICSAQTVDLYNPKVVQATMGSIARVQVHYLDLEVFLAQTALPVYGTFMDGKNIYKESLPKEAIIVLGNEANGISKAIEQLAANKIAIPRFGAIQQTESLNVASAAAIVVSEFRRGFSGK